MLRERLGFKWILYPRGIINIIKILSNCYRHFLLQVQDVLQPSSCCNWNHKTRKCGLYTETSFHTTTFMQRHTKPACSRYMCIRLRKSSLFMLVRIRMVSWSCNFFHDKFMVFSLTLYIYVCIYIYIHIYIHAHIYVYIYIPCYYNMPVNVLV